MFTASGSTAAVNSLPAWNILFAREPEPDLELDETTAGLDETTPPDDDGGASQGPGDDKKQKMIKLALLAVVAGAGLYVAMDPSILMGPVEDPPPAPAPAPPKAAQAPAALPNPPAAPAAVAPTTMAPPPTAPIPSPAQAPQAMPTAPVAPTSAQPKSPMPAMASAPAPAMPSAMPPATPKPAPAASTGLSPLFSEGQPVVVLADPAKPTGPVALMADAGNSRPGPTVAVNTAATVVDGELRNNSWIYAVRTPQGATGWISEKQLQAKP
nr:hypothetical protein [Nitrospirota bacterium]